MTTTLLAIGCYLCWNRIVCIDALTCTKRKQVRKGDSHAIQRSAVIDLVERFLGYVIINFGGESDLLGVLSVLVRTVKIL